MVLPYKRERSAMLSLLLTGVAVSFLVAIVESFSTSSFTRIPSRSLARTRDLVSLPTKREPGTNGMINTLLAAKKSSSGEGGKKRRRRKRKKPPQAKAESTGETPLASTATPATSTTTNVATTAATPSVDISPPSASAYVEADSDPSASLEGEENKLSVEDVMNVANFRFKGPNSIDTSLPPMDEVAGIGMAPAGSLDQEDDGISVPLPDIKDTLRKQRMKAQRRAAEAKTPTKKIDRDDRQALMKLLELDPYADANDDLFEEREYTNISALLGERAKPFLGIPIAALQVGHFIGALVIILMAFIEYPGFPLTNLPSPLRGALQGGLGTIYGINILLAAVAAFKAGERGQPAPLWIAKTFTVGGLALDQLTQLPTTEEVEAAKARKGKRALKNLSK